MLIKAVPATLKWWVYKLPSEKMFEMHAQISAVKLLKFWNGKVILYHHLLGVWLLIHAGCSRAWFQCYDSEHSSTLFDPLCREADVDMPFLLNRLSKHNW